MKTTRTIVLTLILLLAAVLGMPLSSQAAEDTMKIVAIDLGDRNTGEAAMISDGSGKSLLVDSGDTRGRKLFDWLDANGYKNKKFDTLISHWHDDHAGNTAEIILKYNVGTVYMPRTDYLYTDNTAYSSYERTYYYAVRDAAEKRGTRVVWLEKGQTISVGSVKGKVLYIYESPRNESDMTVHYINNQSSVIMFTGGGARYLTVGDIEKPAENRLLKSGVSLKADIFKISHHGLDTSNQQKFLDAVNPAYAYFTSNRSDSGHYTTGDVWASVTRAGRNSNVMGTGYNGTITYTCKGGDITVRAERNTKKMYMRLIDKKTNRTRKATFTFNKATEIRMKKKILNPDKYYTQQLNADGTVFSGSFVQRGGRYYLEKGGVGAYNTFAEKGGKTYWFDLSGKRYEGGMLSAYGKRYYMNPKGDPCRLCGWRTISSRKYYFVGSKYEKYSKNIEGVMLTGFRTVGGKDYYFMDSSCKTYKSADQGMVMNGFFTVDGNLYYGMNSKVKGYKAENHSVIVKNWATINGRLYYMGSNGVVRKGWQTIGGKRYYMGTNGAAAVNKFMTIQGAKYYFDKDGVMLSGGDFTIKDKRYRFDADGKMVKEINCHLDEKGEPVIGWHELDGKTYYGGEDGELARGKTEIDGKVYIFDEEDCHLIGQEDPQNGAEDQQPAQEHSTDSEDSSLDGQEEGLGGEDDGAPEESSEGGTGSPEESSEGDTSASGEHDGGSTQAPAEEPEEGATDHGAAPADEGGYDPAEEGTDPEDDGNDPAEDEKDPDHGGSGQADGDSPAEDCSGAAVEEGADPAVNEGVDQSPADFPEEQQE